MSIDLHAAEQFVHANARVLERHLLAVLLHDGPGAAVVDALRAYRNSDGGFGFALEPDVRDPFSQPAATLDALRVLREAGASTDPMVKGAASWVASVANPDGGVPFVLPTAVDYPRAPWMQPSTDGSWLTFAIAGELWTAGATDEPWLERATRWCWDRLEAEEELGSYWVKFALVFLDAVPDERRAEEALQRLRSEIGSDGSVPVPGGSADERIMPTTLAERPGGRSRTLFTDEQLEADLDRLERGQQDDGGWMFDWLAWSPGQSVECRGLVTVQALSVLRAYGRI
jgi:hypothetical protein